MRTRSGSDSRTGFLTSIQCLDDDDDIAFSLWRVLLRKCINTLWYGWFTRLFFCFLLLLAIFYTFFFLFILYKEIFEAGETGQWSLPFLHGFLCTSPAWVSVFLLLASNLFWSKSALIVTRVYSFCLEFRFPVQKNVWYKTGMGSSPNPDTSRVDSLAALEDTTDRCYREQLAPDQSEFRALSLTPYTQRYIDSIVKNYRVMFRKWKWLIEKIDSRRNN